MKVAVTGGSGFIGRPTMAALLGNGHTTWSVDLSDGHDIRDRDSLAKGLADADCVVHLAGALGTAELFDDPYLAVDANVTGALNVLEWARARGADSLPPALVFITMPDSDWSNLYQATKLCAGKMATAYHREFGIPVTHVRAFNAYGPGQKHGPGHPQKIIPTFATEAFAGRPLPVWGDGTQSVDLVHVDDIAHIFVWAVEHGGANQTIDAGTGIAVQVRAVAEAVNRWTGNQAGLQFLPMRAGETPHTRIVAKGDGWEEMGPELIPSNGFKWERLQQAVEFYKP